MLVPAASPEHFPVLFSSAGELGPPLFFLSLVSRTWRKRGQVSPAPSFCLKTFFGDGSRKSLARVSVVRPAVDFRARAS